MTPEKREEILKELRQELEHDKTSKLLNDSTVSKMVTEK